MPKGRELEAEGKNGRGGEWGRSKVLQILINGGRGRAVEINKEGAGVWKILENLIAGVVWSKF